MDYNHLVTIYWWINGFKCIVILILIYLINQQNNGGQK
jgi:hypothetical protein